MVGSWVRATVPITESARATHHIREEDLATAPGFAQTWVVMEPLLRGKTVLAYGTDFDIRLLRQSGVASQTELAGLNESLCYCVMEAYAIFRGEPDKKPDRRYRRHKLVDACASLGVQLLDAHDAAADAQATVRLLQALARVAEDEREML